MNMRVQLLGYGPTARREMLVIHMRLYLEPTRLEVAEGHRYRSRDMAVEVWDRSGVQGRMLSAEGTYEAHVRNSIRGAIVAECSRAAIGAAYRPPGVLERLARQRLERARADADAAYYGYGHLLSEPYPNLSSWAARRPRRGAR